MIDVDNITLTCINVLFDDIFWAILQIHYISAQIFSPLFSKQNNISFAVERDENFGDKVFNSKLESANIIERGFKGARKRNDLESFASSLHSDSVETALGDSSADTRW